MAPALVFALALAFVALVSFAQSPATNTAPAAATSAAEASKPAWKELSAPQREALAPLAKDWDTFDRSRKLKWLDVAAKYPQLSPDAQKRLHERMAEYVKLTPEQRATARTNFQRAYELPMEQRQSLVQQYQELPPEKKQALADKAAKKADPPRRGTPKPAPKADPAADSKPSTSKP
ncbi:MAG TPA: DUF3106 domain-containing protein [Burkholderiaceae bacterium]|nr:DUF3106 domain-containing protein [Burkholderiaceae bacterium]